MEILKYSIVKTKEQYNEYCKILENLVYSESQNIQNEVELLTLLINKWDNEHNSLMDLNPIELLKSLMTENNMKSKDLVEILELSKGTVSKILNYQKGLSKETIRKLADYFKISQEAFNRPYRITNEVNRHFRNASLMNTKKDMENSIAL